MQPIGDSQQTAETWEVAADLINAQRMRLVFKDENGVYHTVKASYSTLIFGATTEMAILTGEIIEPQPIV